MKSCRLIDNSRKQCSLTNQLRLSIYALMPAAVAATRGQEPVRTVSMQLDTADQPMQLLHDSSHIPCYLTLCQKSLTAAPVDPHAWCDQTGCAVLLWSHCCRCRSSGHRSPRLPWLAAHPHTNLPSVLLWQNPPAICGPEKQHRSSSWDTSSGLIVTTYCYRVQCHDCRKISLKKGAHRHNSAMQNPL